MRKKIIFTLINVVFFNISIICAQETDKNTQEKSFTPPFVFEACENSVSLIAENASGSLLAVSDSNCLLLYDTRDFSLVCRFYDEMVSRIAFYTEHESEFLAVMTKSGQFIVRKLMYINEGWQCDDGEPYFSADCSDVTGRKALTAVSFSRNSDYVAAAFDDNSIQMHFRLRVTAASISHIITKHKAPVYGLEFSRNGEYLASVSTDGQAYIWNSYTSSLIANLNGIYSRAKIPVYFTEDSVYIVSLEGRNSFRISDFSGNTLYSIATGRPITAIRPLKEPDLLAIRNDKGEVMVYSISSRSPLSLSDALASELFLSSEAMFSDSDFTAFEFDSDANYMYAGYKNGQVHIIEAQTYLDDTSMFVMDVSLAEKGSEDKDNEKEKFFGKIQHQSFSSFSVSGGTNYMTKPYLLSANLRGEYLYSKKISPFLVGGGLILSVGFPCSDFPSNYKISGDYVSAPKLLSATLYAPAGYAFSPWNNEIRILTLFKAGAKISSLALITGQGQIIGEPDISFFISAGAGMQIKGFEFDLNCEYDTTGKFSPSLYAGYVIRWEEK